MVTRYLTKGLVIVIIALVLMTNINCAAIFDGTKKPSERSDDIMWGYVVLDVILTGPIGIIIDFATGAIYKRSGIFSDVEQDMKTKLARHIPVYRVTGDNIYSVVLSDKGDLVFTELAKESIPPPVLASIEKQMK